MFINKCYLGQSIFFKPSYVFLVTYSPHFCSIQHFALVISTIFPLTSRSKYASRIKFTSVALHWKCTFSQPTCNIERYLKLISILIMQHYRNRLKLLIINITLLISSSVAHIQMHQCSPEGFGIDPSSGLVLLLQINWCQSQFS